MELDLKEFSLTLAVGLAVAGVCWLALRCVWALGARRLADLVLLKREMLVVPFLVVAVGLLAIGMIAEDLSKNALAERDPAAFAPQFRRMMPAERYDRSQVLTTPTSTSTADSPYNPDVCRHPLPPGVKDDRPVQFQYSAIGDDLRNLLVDIVRKGTATLEERNALARLIAFESGWKRSNGASIKSGMPPIYTTSCKEYLDGLAPLYYLAKNHAYLNDNFFKELESLRVRFEFARSLCYVLLAGAYLVIVLYLAQSTITMWRDIGGGKTAISIGLAFVVLLAAVDVVVFLPSRSAVDFLTNLFGEDAAKGFDKFRVLMLPATFLFVCLYRTRRLWPRLGKTIRVSIDSTVPDPPILRYPREWDARNAFLSVVALALLFFPVSLAYESDHTAFLKRVYAYYLVVRGEATIVVPPRGGPP